MSSGKTLIVTGGAGFIGSAFVRFARDGGYRVFILDKLTYAGNRDNLEGVLEPGLCELVVGDIGDADFVSSVLRSNEVSAVVNLAAETHVDNSITYPQPFIDTNVTATLILLRTCHEYFVSLPANRAQDFVVLHVSTDEVFGSLSATGSFTEDSCYAPRSPYAASKAAGDHLVQAWSHTYGLPTIITYCGNNFGPRQHREKLIPNMIASALTGSGMPVYGNGMNVRDWIYVEDHCKALMLALEKGTRGESYCFGGSNEWTNIDLVRRLCVLLDQREPRGDGTSYAEQIAFVSDRPGHDFRYALDWRKAATILGYAPRTEFDDALSQTIDWYLAHRERLQLTEGASA